MAEVIRDPAVIDGHLRTLRHYDKRTFDGPLRDFLDSMLDMHWITVERSPEDSWHGPGIPLRHPLSLLDEDRRRCRVSEIRIELGDRLDPDLAGSATIAKQ